MSYGSFIFSSPIRFTQGWEDYKVVEKSLNVKGNVLACILSSGDNILNLLRYEPSKIYAFDISIEQVYEVKLKITAIKNLNYLEFLTLFGYNGKNNERFKIFNLISKKLDKNTYDFWIKHKNIIEKGISFQGYWENYSSFWKYPLKLFVGKDYKRYIESEKKSERKEIFDKRLNRPGLIFLSKIFTAKTIQRIVNAKGNYYKNLPKSFDHQKHFWRLLENYFVNVECKNNQYHSWVLTGEMPDDKQFWQPYLREENYELLKNNIDKIEIINKDILNGLKNFDNETFDGFYLSDIFDWMDKKKAEDILLEIIRVGKNNSKIIIFVLNPMLNLPEKIMNHIEYNEEFSEGLREQERVGLYSKIFSLEVKK